jgi:hypothetical protein
MLNTDKILGTCIIIDTQPIFPYFHAMKLFSLFSGSSLSPAWNYSAQHIVWRIMFSGTGHIIGEDRNTEARTVSFFCLDAATGKTLWQHKNFDEQWWIGVDAVHNNRLYLHGFRKPDMPEHKNIYAVDLNTAELVWKNTDCTFLAIQPPYIYGYKDLFERRVYYRLDENTGILLEELTALPDGVEPNIQYEKTDFTFARPVSDNGTEAWNIARETKDYISAESIEQDGFIVLNTYSRNLPPAEGLKNTLSVIDTTTKKKVYSDVLNRSTLYPVPDSFFADGNRVYYIKERKTFVAVDLRRK